MIGVVGLGNMGRGMAGVLARASRPVWGFDLAPVEIAGVTRAAELPALMSACAIVVLSLPHAAAVGAAVDAFIAHAPGDAVLVDTSTIAVADTRAFAARVAASGRAMLDAPVSGGPSGAAAGKLTMMVGGEAAALAKVRPVLDLLAANVIHVGASGAGLVAKLANNLLVASHLVTAAEALGMAARAGVKPEALLPVINAATGRSAATELNWPRWIASGAFDSGFAAGLMRKDVRLALELAEDCGASLEATRAAAAAWFESAVADDADFNRVAAALMEQGHG